MFGYVRPRKGSLRVAEYERFRAVYCGLCHALSRRYGPLASLLLSYDLAFYAAAAEGLASAECADGEQCTENAAGQTGCKTCYRKKRCLAHPFHRRPVACNEEGKPTPALELAADLTILLGCLKLRDDIQDRGSFWKKLRSRLLLLLLGPAERKAKRLRPGLSAEAEEALGELRTLESERCESLDRCADCFARMLRAAGAAAGGAGSGTFGELLYHVGRWVYIIDACDDLPEDCGRGDFNPVAARYGAETLTDEIKAEVEHTLALSLDTAYRMAERLDFGAQSGYVENVLLVGLDDVTRQVLSGEKVTFTARGL